MSFKALCFIVMASGFFTTCQSANSEGRLQADGNSVSSGPTHVPYAYFEGKVTLKTCSGGVRPGNPSQCPGKSFAAPFQIVEVNALPSVKPIEVMPDENGKYSAEVFGGIYIFRQKGGHSATILASPPPTKEFEIKSRQHLKVDVEFHAMIPARGPSGTPVSQPEDSTNHED